MTKPAATPPTRDKPSPTAPPPPPPWRHWLWTVAILAFFLLYFVLPTMHTSQSVSLNYTQFLHDVSNHQVKTMTYVPDGSASGTLHNGHAYTTVIPNFAQASLASVLKTGDVQVTATTSTTSFGAEVLSWVILLLPFLVLGYLWGRLSSRAGGQLQGASGVGRSKAKVFDEDRPKTTLCRRGRLRRSKTGDRRGGRLPP